MVIRNQKNEGSPLGRLNATFCEDSLVLQDSRSAVKPDVASAFLGARASVLCMKGLRLIRSMAYVIPEAGLVSTQKLFEIIYGPFTVQGTMPHYDLDFLPVDCGFDAGFGFPCATGKMPKDNGRTYVQELPKSQNP